MTTLTDSHIFVGDSSNVATDVPMSGDVTIDDTGATTIKTDVSLAGSPTTTTQSYPDSSTKIATTGYVDAAISISRTTHSIGFTAAGPAVGKQNGYFTFPVGGQITAWSFAVDTGTATVKTWKIASGTASPTVANSISTSGVSISSGTAVRSTTLTDFTTTTVSAGDIFAFDLTAFAGCSQITFQLDIKTGLST
jgi:hypothetical protein